MDYGSSLYTILQDVFAENDIWALDSFTNEAFFDSLAQNEREKLALLFLKRASHLVTPFTLVKAEKAEQMFLDSLTYAEKLLPVSAAFHCLSAHLLFRFGEYYQKGRFLLLALDRMAKAHELDPGFFEKSFEWWHLWGNILTALSLLVNETSFVEAALPIYEKAAQNLALNSSPEKREATEILLETFQYSLEDEENSIHKLYWDWAKAWKLLGKLSGEIVDFKNAIIKFTEASQFEPASPSFHIDFGEVLANLGMLTGETSYLEKALEFYKSVISTSSLPDQKPLAAHSDAWKFYAMTKSSLYYLTHDEEHFKSADAAFNEALIAAPNQIGLWLEWGRLFLHSGKLHQELKEIEIAVEKLTSSKIHECDPMKTSALLGEALVLLGVFLDDYKFIKEGCERIFSALELTPENGPLIHAAGLAHLYHGLYFSDVQEISKAIACFESKINQGDGDVEDWHGIFEAYMGLGLLKKEDEFLLKAISAIEHVSNLRPASPYYLDEWGLVLLRFHQMDTEKVFPIEKATQKFQEALAINDDPEILFHYGCALDLMGDTTGCEEDYEMAIEALSRAVDFFPSASYIRYHLAIALSHYGELTANVESLNEAVDFFETVLQTENEDDRVWCELGYALLNLSALISDPASPDKENELRIRAEKVLIRAIELGNKEANYHLACLYSLEGLYDASIRYLERAERAECLPPVEDLEHDEWLEGIRSTETFREFLITRKQQ